MLSYVNEPTKLLVTKMTAIVIANECVWGLSEQKGHLWNQKVELPFVLLAGHTLYSVFRVASVIMMVFHGFD